MAYQFEPTSLENQFVSSDFRGIGMPWRIFLFALFLFGFSLFIFFGLKLGYGSYLSFRSNALDEEFKKLSLQVSERDQASLTAFYSQVVNLQSLLGSHFFTANIFSFLEKRTVPSVYYTNVSFNIKDFALQLSGRSASVDGITEQLAAYDAAPEIERATLGDLNFESVGVAFQATLVFKPVFFEKIE